MSDPEGTAHWKALADLIGVEPTATPPEEEAEASDRAADEERDKTAEPSVGRPPERKTRQPRAPRLPADWDGLASTFGLAPELPPPAESPEESEVGDSSEDTSPTVTADREASGATEEEAPVPLIEDDSEDDSLPEFGEQDSDVAVEAGLSDDLAFSDEDSWLETDQAALLDEPEDDPESEDEGEQLVRRKRRKRGRRRRQTDAEESSESVLDADDQEAEVESDLAPSPHAEADEGGEPEEAEEEDRGERVKRKRRRRRRVPRQEDSPADEDSGEPDLPAEATAAQAVGDEDDGLDGDDETPSAGAASRAKHRKIPTWEEAIGIVISSNLEARSKNPSNESRGGSRGRGRGRGGRHS